MRATLHPPVGTWLYFTLINEDGQMAFSTTFAQQLKEEKLAESRGIG
jgi:cell division protein YceG involved in septum cleavage